NLDELLYEVGPPTPVHDPPGSPLGTDASGRLHDWRELHRQHLTTWRVSGVARDWLARNDRVLLNERDTAFHLAMSDRPRIDGFATNREVAFNRLRLTLADFDRFLGALTDDRGNAVGATWQVSGPDDDLVVFLCRSLRNGGSNSQRQPSGHYLALTLGNNPINLLQDNVLGEGFDLVDDPIPADVSVDTWIT